MGRLDHEDQHRILQVISGSFKVRQPPLRRGGGTNTASALRNVPEKLIKRCLLNQGTGFPRGSVVKNPPANTGDKGSIPGSGRSPGGGNGNPLQCSCLENPMDRGAWRTTVHGVAKSRTQLKRLSLHTTGSQLAKEKCTESQPAPQSNV